jgi:inorganic phosphate transporter, PiT family
VFIIEILVIIILMIAGFYVGWNIGANDAANCIGTSVGAGILTFKRAITLMVIFVCLGAVIQGLSVMKTVGKGMVLSDVESFIKTELPTSISKDDFQKHILDKTKSVEKEIVFNSYQFDGNYYLLKSEDLLTVSKEVVLSSLADVDFPGVKALPPEFRRTFRRNRLPDRAIFVALISAGFFVTLATFASIPVSTSQAIVGGVAGVGIGMVGFNSAYFDISVMVRILQCWMINPLLSALLAFPLYLILVAFLKRTKKVYLWNKILTVLVIITTCYVSYSLGANDVGNAVGPLYNKFQGSIAGAGRMLGLFGGIAMGVGSVTFGKRVTETIGKKLTPLDLPGAFIAQLSSAFGVHFFTLLGVPVSTSQSIVGAVLGVGLAKGVKSVSVGKLAQIVVGWVLTPTCAAIFAMFVYRLVDYLLNYFL